MRLSKIRLKDIINPLKWWSFLIGWLRDLFFGRFFRVHLLEQYTMRITECRDCVEAGSCPHCGCSMPQKAWDKNASCSQGKWGPIKSAKDWEYYKKAYNVTVEYKFYPQTKEDEPRRKK